MKVVSRTLKNNLKVLFVDGPGNMSSSVQVWFKAGSAFEAKEDEGMAHFLEHMFFKGTKKRPGAMIADEIEAFGGELNAFTSFDYTCYYTNTPYNKTKKGIEILLDMVANPTFEKETISPEKDVVLEEHKRAKDHPGQFAFLQIQKNCFNGKYSHPILGSDKKIKKFSRDKVLKFRKDNYNLSNMLLVVAGDLKKIGSIDNIVEKFKFPSGIENNYSKFLLKNNAKISIHQKDVRMSQLTFLFNATDYLSDKAPIEDIVLNCLGNGESSRLHRDFIIDDNLASCAASSTMYMAHGGVHLIRFSFPHDLLSKILNKFSKLLIKLKENGFDQWEIDKVKNQYIASKIYEKESLENYAFNLGNNYIQTGDFFCEDKFLDKINDVSIFQTNKMLKEIFSRKMHIVLQIPKSESIEKSDKELNRFKLDLISNFKVSGELLKKHKIIKSSFDSKVKIIELKKGITLLHRENKMTPTYVMHTYLRGGISEETSKNNGTYNLLSSLLTQGYGEYSQDKIRRELDNYSANISSFSGKNAYGLTLHGLTSNISLCIPHLFGSLMDSSFNKKEFDFEIEQIDRTLEQQKEDPVKQCFDQVGNVMFGSHPYSMNVLGTQETIKTFSNEQIGARHRKNLKNKNLLITYCGHNSLDEVVELILPYLDGLKPRVEKIPKEKHIKGKIADKFVSFNREQAHLFIGLPIAKLGTKENIYFKMLNTYLSGQSSELFVEVRDNLGLCYSVQPVYFSALEGGYWGIYMATSNDKVKKAKEALLEILNKIKTMGISKQEFNRIKQITHGQGLVNIQTNDDYANIYSIPFLQGKGVDFYYDNIRAINEMNYEKFNKSIKTLLQRTYSTVLVGKD